MTENIHGLITLGIGPETASIEHSLLFGLNMPFGGDTGLGFAGAGLRGTGFVPRSPGFRAASTGFTPRSPSFGARGPGMTPRRPL